MCAPIGVTAGHGSGRRQAQREEFSLPSRDSLVEPQRLAACPIPLGGMPALSPLALSTPPSPSPLLDQVVDLISGLERAQPVCEVLVVLGLGLADLAVVHLQVPVHKR